MSVLCFSSFHCIEWVLLSVKMFAQRKRKPEASTTLVKICHVYSVNNGTNVAHSTCFKGNSSSLTFYTIVAFSNRTYTSCRSFAVVRALFESLLLDHKFYQPHCINYNAWMSSQHSAGIGWFTLMMLKICGQNALNVYYAVFYWTTC